MTARGVFLDLQSLAPQDLSLKPLQDCQVDWSWHDSTTPQQLLARAEGASILVTNKVRVERAHMAALPDLKLICVAATGTDNVDLVAAQQSGIVVSNARNYATASVVEHVFALLLTLTRRLDAYRERVRAGDWSRSEQFCLFGETIEELAGKTLGIIGYGTLGQAVAGAARALSMRVEVAQRLHGTPLPDRIDLDHLLESSDVISLHCPLSEQTRNLIGHDQLRRMKRSAILINTARGGIVDEAALLTALQEGWIAAAGVDVMKTEPPAPDSPLLRLDSEHLIVTPHIAWASRSARQRLVSEIAENISAYLAGTPRNPVR